MHLKRIGGRYYAYESERRGGRSTSRCWGRIPDQCVSMCLELALDCREARETEAAQERLAQTRMLAPLVGLRDEVVEYGRTAGRSTQQSRKPWDRLDITAGGEGPGE